MPAVWIAVQLLDILDHLGTHRIEVEVTHKFQKITLHLADNGLEPVLEYMPNSPVTPLERD